MIDITESTIERIVIHKIGCKSLAENDPRKENFYSKHEIQFIDEDTQSILKNFFGLVLKSPEYYKFQDNNSSVPQEVRRIFEQKANFYDASIQMAKKIYNITDEENQCYSELYLVYFSNCVVDDITTTAVGIYMSDAKETFLKIMQNENEVNFQQEKGISLKKLDRGCIIFNVEEDSGYIIKAQDNTKGDNVYWIDSFLEAKAIENEYFNTESFLKICKEFNDEVLAKNESVKNEERIQFLQNSLNYFQTNQTFNQEQFANETIGNEAVIHEFNNFKQRYRNNHEIEAPETFDIDETAVKKSKKYLRSVIKLDKNFHIYVHSRPEFLQRGYDEEKGKSFYKVFFEIES